MVLRELASVGKASALTAAAAAQLLSIDRRRIGLLLRDVMVVGGLHAVSPSSHCRGL
jgi:hypothetical protein